MQQLRDQRTVWCAESAAPALYRNPADALKEHVTNAMAEPGLEAANEIQLLEIAGLERASCPVGVGVACRTGSPLGCSG